MARRIICYNPTARHHIKLCIWAVRAEMRDRKRRWNRSTILTRTADMLARHAREAGAAGFTEDQKLLAHASQCAWTAGSITGIDVSTAVA